jgi:hypothetical protein
LKRVREKAHEKDAYTQLYNEGKELLLSGETQEFEFYFEAVHDEFKDLEEKYTYARNHRKSDE